MIGVGSVQNIWALGKGQQPFQPNSMASGLHYFETAVDNLLRRSVMVGESFLLCKTPCRGMKISFPLQDDLSFHKEINYFYC